VLCLVTTAGRAPPIKSLPHSCRSMVGNALEMVPSLERGVFDFVIHDVVTGGSTAEELMDERFLMQLKLKLQKQVSETPWTAAT
jgi:hypothetical protein